MQLPRITDLTLVLTERCNLGCTFCYVPKRDRSMPEALALQAVDWLMERAPRGARPSVGFFGGEPLLARQLLNRVVAHGRQRYGDRIRFTMPTNGTLVDRATAAELREGGIELALSVDSTSAPAGSQHTLEGLRANLDQLRRFAPMVRLTVTPDNVAQLRATVVSLFGAGFSRIMHQPALESPWPARAVRSWQEQHEALARWACERLERRQPLPDLVVLEGIIARLGGRAAAGCGAGVRTAALDPAGRLFGCFRSVYAADAEKLVLADLIDGSVNEPLVAAYARLHPHRARPQRGSCRSCAARDGCTAYCPAMGQVLLGDLRAVPRDACQLMSIQVAICRELRRRTRRLQRAHRLRVGSRVAAAALALGLATGSAACDDGRALPSDAAVEGAIPGLCDAAPYIHDMLGPGQCPAPVPDAGVPDAGVPGLCDAGSAYDVAVPGVCVDLAAPGLCPIAPDQMVPGLCDAPNAHDMLGPGLCPVLLDGGPVQPDTIGPGPGLCPAPLDSGPAAPDSVGPGPGLCPAPLDSGPAAPDSVGPGPGLCPAPPPDGSTPGLC